MRALSIRQPYAELVLRGVKTIEYRTQPTRIVGERFHIYASKTGVPANAAGRVWSADLAAPTGDNAPPAYMLELAKLLILDDLPRGVIVGSAVIDRVTRGDDGLYHWHLVGVERAKTFRKPRGHPQPVWFNPF